MTALGSFKTMFHTQLKLNGYVIGQFGVLKIPEESVSFPPHIGGAGVVIGGIIVVTGTGDGWCLGIIVPGVGFSGMEAVDKEITVVTHSITSHCRDKHLKPL